MTEKVVQTLEVSEVETGIRLDRWFKRRFPALTHGRLEKLLRTGQVRVDGKRAKAKNRLEQGQMVRVPPLGEAAQSASERHGRQATAAETDDLLQRVLLRDDTVIVLNKPPGLAVQGGTRTPKHLDAMLDVLRFGAAERPSLVHRLDRDTSGILLLARHRKSAAALAEAFQKKTARKLYWALVAGAPPDHGTIEAPLDKQPGPRGESMVVSATGKRAITHFQVVERSGNRLAWLALFPVTGRTHQLRVHCAHLGTPIVGDAKYAGREAFPRLAGLGRGLHLHARAIVMPHPEGGWIEAEAPLPEHMATSFSLLGFDFRQPKASLVVFE
ncbi:MAG: RluA family pseudouridine synthase [Alphaproteobacteria bacterium]|nr:RluA family pseudouridine synthase [Alphaproteobacteria bacterium]